MFDCAVIPSGADFIKICARLFRTNTRRNFFWQMAFGIWQTDLANGAFIWQISTHITIFGKVWRRMLVKLNSNLEYCKCCGTEIFKVIFFDKIFIHRNIFSVKSCVIPFSLLIFYILFLILMFASLLDFLENTFWILIELS